ncbi:hypothetical protein, partial [Pseudomonas syringae]|uniref:hypothetical protein n=1 Tax=Pseudomonas syringae TaxID=317 RepID=UPI001FEF08A8
WSKTQRGDGRKAIFEWSTRLSARGLQTFPPFPHPTLLLPVGYFFFQAIHSHMARFPSVANIGNNLQRPSAYNTDIIPYIQHRLPAPFNEFVKGYFLTGKKSASFAGD